MEMQSKAESSIHGFDKVYFLYNVAKYPFVGVTCVSRRRKSGLGKCNLYLFSDLINLEVLKKCKKNVRLINVARGGIIDEEGLVQALDQGYCGGAGLDVFVEVKSACICFSFVKKVFSCKAAFP